MHTLIPVYRLIQYIGSDLGQRGGEKKEASLCDNSAHEDEEEEDSVHSELERF